MLINNDGSAENTLTEQYAGLENDGRKADIVILNLGTNDEIHIEDNGAAKEAFQNRYRELLGKIRQNNPEAEIEVFYGMMFQGLSDTISQTVDTFASDTNDKKIHFHKYSQTIYDMEDGIRSGHPSVKAHMIFADETLRAMSQIENKTIRGRK